MHYNVLTTALAIMASATSALVLPGMTAKEVTLADGAKSTAYIADSFVPTSGTTASTSTVNLTAAHANLRHNDTGFSDGWNNAGQMDYLCDPRYRRAQFPTALVQDCEYLRAIMYMSNGYWACRDWTPGEFHPLAMYGTCQIWISLKDGDSTTRMGNGDVFSILGESLWNFNMTVDGEPMVGGTGEHVCNNTQLNWIL